MSRDSTALRALFLESCEACVREAADIDNLRQGNQHVVGGTLTLTSLTALRGAESGIGVTGVSTRAAVTIVAVSYTHLECIRDSSPTAASTVSPTAGSESPTA